MASATIPSNSGITPIFSDEEAKRINDYFKNLYILQSKKQLVRNYLTIQDLKFLIDMLNNSIDNKKNNNKKNNNKKNNNNYKINKKNIKDLCVLFLSIIDKYNKNSDEDIKQQIKTLKKILIEQIILNPKYFNQLIIQQKEQEFFIKFNDDDEYFLEKLENFVPVNSSNNNNSKSLILPSNFPSVPSKPLPKIIKNENTITLENAVRDIKNFVDTSFTKEDSEVRKELTTLKKQYGKVFLGTR
jgi:hypothetical protein